MLPMAEAVSLRFPDNSVRDYAAGTSGRDVAESISKSLAKKAVAVAIDGELRDLSDPVADGRIEIVTRDDPARWNSSATTRRMSWPRRCRSCGPARR
jgi:hypothetical protein